MGSLFFVKGQIPPLTDEQKTDEELARMKPARLRGSIWKRYKVRLVED